MYTIRYNNAVDVARLLANDLCAQRKSSWLSTALFYVHLHTIYQVGGLEKVEASGRPVNGIRNSEFGITPRLKSGSILACFL